MRIIIPCIILISIFFFSCKKDVSIKKGRSYNLYKGGELLKFRNKRTNVLDTFLVYPKIEYYNKTIEGRGFINKSREVSVFEQFQKFIISSKCNEMMIEVNSENQLYFTYQNKKEYKDPSNISIYSRLYTHQYIDTFSINNLIYRHVFKINNSYQPDSNGLEPTLYLSALYGVIKFQGGYNNDVYELEH